MVDMDAQSRHDAAKILEIVRSKGVALWLENGELRFRAKRGALTDQELQRLRRSRDHIVSLMASAVPAPESEPKLCRRATRDAFPLTYSQTAHWNFRKLPGRRTLRQVAGARRLRGRLEVPALQECLTCMVRRHEALRTRMIVTEGAPAQIIQEAGSFALVIHDLTRVSESDHDEAVRHLVDTLVLEPIDVEQGPLFGALLARLREDEHVLILAFEHLISDGDSLGILWRDIFSMYEQLLMGRTPVLPAVAVQFSDYAIWQKQIEASWVRRHQDYWRQLAAHQPLTFPSCEFFGAGRTGWDVISFRIDSDFRSSLLAWSRSNRTTLALGVFAAYVGLVLRWCKASEGTIGFETNGRTHSELENTVGFFATPVYMYVQLDNDDSFLDLLRLVVDRYCVASEHADFLYLGAQGADAAYARSPMFNWMNATPESHPACSNDSPSGIACSPVLFPHPLFDALELDGEPCIYLLDVADEINVEIAFPRARFYDADMRRFGRNFLAFMKALMDRPELPVSRISLQ